MIKGYKFYLGKTLLPITPSSLEITVGNQNETITLINEGEVNLLKQPSLTTVKFTARFPRRNAPYCLTTPKEPSYYLGILEKLKTEKATVSFKVTRWVSKKMGSKSKFESTNITCSLEEYTITEDAEEGDDVFVEIELKQFRKYGTKTVAIKQNNTNTTVKPPTSTAKPKVTYTTYTVKKGDCLWNISKKFYGKGSEWKTIYNANKDIIEKTAKKYGRKSSSNGHWIYPNTKLKIPKK